ncbi:MAG: FadR/GntR family transcriptional regulator [Gammaproteobacteria bacterium]
MTDSLKSPARPAGAAAAPRAPVRRAFEDVTARIRDLVHEGSLKPGDRLPAERELARRLGIGRPALREALRALESAGLLELRKGKTGGAFISAGRPSVMADNMSDLLRVGSVSIPELFEARIWIQTALVRAASERATEQDLQALEENVAGARRLHDAGDVQRRIQANIEFHNLLAQAAHNPVMVVIVRALTDALHRLVAQVGSEPPPDTFAVRRRLVRALRAHDTDTAAEAMAHIIRVSEQMYLRLAQSRERSRAPAPAWAARGRVRRPGRKA